MPSFKHITLIGATPSPYTHKMIGLLRYRQIPYRIKWGTPEQILRQMDIEPPKPALLPTFVLDNENGEAQAICDSTPIIRRLEEDFSERSVLPTDPALAFIDYLLEDFADEWCTKYMFHYRWHPQADADNAGTLLPLGYNVSMPSDQHNQFKEYIASRQISRLYVVGSNETTAPIIDASYRRFLAAMEAHLSQQPYMLGHRPGASDFALYGQLTQLVGFDPTPRAIAHQTSLRTVAWVDQMADLSGLEVEEAGWTSLEQQPESLRGLLAELGRMYVPALLANARALQAGEKNWQVEFDGALWSQQTFPYQVKCLNWIKQRYAKLSAEDRQRVDLALDGSGCEALFTRL
ncbi:MAG: glutathione S-transferase family protein [Porticoccaceae bacterium]|mgnify:FL=1|nr:glutathione S-transferase family protein [Porticoccaceae bacterium]